MTHISAIINEDNRKVAIHETFGHLFPDDGTVKIGKICATIGIYGDITIIDEDIEIEGSPWWHESSHNFVYEALKNETNGAIYELCIKAEVIVVDEDEDEDEESSIRQIEITEISRRLLKEAYGVKDAT